MSEIKYNLRIKKGDRVWFIHQEFVKVGVVTSCTLHVSERYEVIPHYAISSEGKSFSFQGEACMSHSEKECKLILVSGKIAKQEKILAGLKLERNQLLGITEREAKG